MANRQPLSETRSELDGLESANSVGTVAQDFAALVSILERQLELIPASDHETRVHIAQAKAAAERGAQLSRKLLERMDSSV